MVLQRSGYEYELLLSGSLLNAAYGGVPTQSQKIKTNDQIGKEANTLQNRVAMDQSRRMVLVTVTSVVPVCCLLRSLCCRYREEFMNEQLDGVKSRLRNVIERALIILMKLYNNTIFHHLTSRIVENCISNLTISVTDMYKSSLYDNGNFPPISRDEFQAVASTCKMSNAIANLVGLLTTFSSSKRKTSTEAKVIAAKNAYIASIYKFLLHPDDKSSSVDAIFSYCFDGYRYCGRSDVNGTNGKLRVNEGRILTIAGAHVRKSFKKCARLVQLQTDRSHNKARC